MMDEMTPIERAVWAVEAHQFKLPPGSVGLQGKVNIPNAHAKEIVRIVLLALREPTARMVVAGANETDNGDGELHSRKWRAMLDAMLEEG